MAARAWGGDCVEIDFGGNRAFRSIEQLFEPRMQLAEGRDDRLRAQPQRCRPARMPGGACVGKELQVGDGRSGRVEQRDAPRPLRRRRRSALPFRTASCAAACRRRGAASLSGARCLRGSGGRSRTDAPTALRGRDCAGRPRSAPGAARAASTFISSLIGFASRHGPPPNASASSSEMKLQVTASSRPRAAAVRRTLRSISLRTRRGRLRDARSREAGALKRPGRSQ